MKGKLRTLAVTAAFALGILAAAMSACADPEEPPVTGGENPPIETKTYTLTLDAGDGAFLGDVVTVFEVEENTAIASVIADADLTTPDESVLSRYEYDFKAWSLERNGGALTDADLMTADTTVYATWELADEVTPVVWYDGAEAEDFNETYTVKTRVADLLEEFIAFNELEERTGYTFRAAYDEDGEQLVADDALIGDTKTFYLGYVANQYDVTLVLPDGATVEGGTSLKATYDSALELHTPTREKYVFDGWYTDKECTEEWDNVVPANDFTLYAKMSTARSTVTYYNFDEQLGLETPFEIYETDTVTVPECGYEKAEGKTLQKALDSGLLVFVEGAEWLTEAGEVFDFDAYSAQETFEREDIKLYANYYTKGMTFTTLEDGTYQAVTTNIDKAAPYVTFPYLYRETTDGTLKPVTSVDGDIPDPENLKDASKATAVYMPATVKRIEDGTANRNGGAGTGPFSYLYSVGKVVFAANSQLEFIGHSAFNLLGSQLGEGKYATLAIPEGVTEIGPYAFHNAKLTSLDLPASLSTLHGNDGSDGSNAGQGSFENVQVQGDITFADNCALTEIPARAFFGAKMKRVVFGKNSQIAKFGQQAFAASSLTEIALPDSMRTLGEADAEGNNVGNYGKTEGVFYDCTGLKTVTLNSGLTTIGGFAFNGCTALEGISIPSSVTYIGPAAFMNAFAEKSSVTVEANAELVLGEGVFYGAKAETITFVSLKTLRGMTSETYSAPTDNMIGTNMPQEATEYKIPLFFNTAFTTIDLGTALEEVGNYALAGAKAQPVFPSSVNKWGVGVYYSASGEAFESITLPASMTEIPAHTFENSSVKTLTGLENVTKVGASAFAGCTQLTALSFGEGLESLDLTAFTNCPATLTISEANEKYGSLQGGKLHVQYTTSEALEAVTEDYDLLMIYDKTSDALAYNSMESVMNALNEKKPTFTAVELTLPEGLKEIPKDAYKKNINLTKVVFPKSLTTIGESAFDGASKLAEVVFAEDGNLKTIGNRAFAVTAVVSLNIPASVETIGTIDKEKAAPTGTSLSLTGEGTTGAFTASNAITSITIAEGNHLKTLGDSTFFSTTSKEIETFTWGAPAEGVTTEVGHFAFFRRGAGTNSATAAPATDHLGFAGMDFVIPAHVTYLGMGNFGRVSTDHTISFAEGSQLKTIDAAFFAVNYGNYGSATAKGINPVVLGGGGGSPADQKVSFYTFTVELPESVEEIVHPLFGTKEMTGGVGVGYPAGSFELKLAATKAPETVPEDMFSHKRLLKVENLPYDYLSKDNLFKGNTGLEELTLTGDASALTSIGAHAFDGCSNLNMTFEIPETVTSIGASAFKGCKNLTLKFGAQDKAKWYQDLDRGDADIFTDCQYDASIGEVIPFITSPDGYTLVKYISPKTDVEVPETITSIAANAFTGSAAVTVNLPSSVKTISASAFEGADALTTVTFKGEDYMGLTIGNNAFKGTALQSFTVPKGTLSIGTSAFDGVSTLTSLAFADGFTTEGLTIGDYAFRKTGLTGALVLPEGVTSIGVGAFSNIPSTAADVDVAAADQKVKLSAVTIPTTVKSIGNFAFEWVTTLTTLTFTERGGESDPTPLTIGNYAFTATQLTGDLTLPEGLTTIGSGTFSDYAAAIADGKNAVAASYRNQKMAITKVVFPTTLTKIGDSAFMFVKSLTTIEFKTLTASSVSIGNYAFNHTALTGSLELPEKVGTIGKGAFANIFGTDKNGVPLSGTTGLEKLVGTVSLTSVTIPAKVTTTGSSTFAYVKTLTSVAYAERGTATLTIGAASFYETGLTGTFLPTSGGKITISTYAYYHCPLTSIDLSKVGTIGTYAFADSNLKTYSDSTSLPEQAGTITSLEIPSTVTAISEGAFMWQRSLETLTFAARDGATLTIGGYAFLGTKLKGDETGTLVLPEGVTTIGTYAFAAVVSSSSIGNSTTNAAFIPTVPTFTSVSFPSTVTKIDTAAFAWVKSLTSVKFAEGGQKSSMTIGNFAFNMTSLTGALTLPEKTTTIGTYAFANAVTNSTTQFNRGEKEIGTVTLTSVVIPSTVTKVDTGAFAQVNTLTSVDFKDSTSTSGFTAGDYSFWYTGLTSVTLPARGTTASSIYNLGNQAFAQTSITQVTIKHTLKMATFNNSNAPSAGKHAFEGLTVTVYVPESLLETYKAGAAWESYTSGDTHITLAAIEE